MQEYQSNVIPENSNVLIIGISELKESTTLENLLTVKNSVEKISDILTDKMTTDFLPQNVHCIKRGNNTDILIKLKEICDKSTDTLLVYYCGHGLPGETADLILTADNTRVSNKEISGILWNDFKELIEQSRAKNKIIILDCCYSGLATSSLGLNETGADHLQISGSYLITAVKGINKASADLEKEYTRFSGIFIRILLNGIRGKGILLSIENIYAEAVKKSIDIDINKIPDKKITGSTGEFKLVYNKSCSSQKTAIENEIALNPIRGEIFRKLENDFQHSKVSNFLSVLLVKTAVDHPIKPPDFGVPLGLWSLKSYLKVYGYHVDVFDERLEILRQSKNINFKKIFSNYDIIGFSVCTSEVPVALKYAKIAKNLGKTTVFGGIFTKSNEAYLLKHENQVDYVIPAVATQPFLRLLETLRLGNQEEPSSLKIEGIYSRSTINGNKVNPWAAETLPSISESVYKDLTANYKQYLDGKIDIVTGRGCAYVCKFCSISRETRRRTFKDETEIVNEIERHVNAGFNKISIKDENFVDEIKRTLVILKECKKRDLDVHFKIKSRIDTIRDIKFNNELLIDTLKNCNVREIQFGVETIDETLLGIIKKGYRITDDTIYSFFQTVMEKGIKVNASFVLGLPEEGAHHHERLVQFIRKFSNNDMMKVYINFYTPHPFLNSFQLPPDSGIVTKDLSLFTHKNPIVIPQRWRYEEKKSMIDCYDEIVDLTKSKKFNPPINNKQRQIFLNKNRLNDTSLPFYR